MKRLSKIKVLKFLGYFSVSQLLLIWSTPLKYIWVSIAAGLWFTYLIVNPVYLSRELRKKTKERIKSEFKVSKFLLPYDAGYLEVMPLATQILLNSIFNVFITMTLSVLLIYFGGIR